MPDHSSPPSATANDSPRSAHCLPSDPSQTAEYGQRLLQAELIYGPARTEPWKTVEDVELVTLSWVCWHNTARLHSYLNDVPPTEFEATVYDAQRIDQPMVGIQ